MFPLKNLARKALRDLKKECHVEHFSLQAAPEVVMMTTSGAASNEKSSMK